MDFDELLYHKRNNNVYYAKLDLILLNTELKQEVLRRIDEHSASFVAICKDYDINITLMRQFLNTRNIMSHKRYAAMQWDYLILCRALGLEVRIVVIDVPPILEGKTMDRHKAAIDRQFRKITDNNRKFFENHEDSDS